MGTHLRRILLDCVGGIALCGVKLADINGPVKTKFSTLVGTNKATFFLISSLKQIIFSENDDERESLSQKTISFSEISSFSLKVKSKDEEIIIKAGDFVEVGGSNKITIKNPDLELAVLSPNSILEITLFCRKGFGYLIERKQEDIFSELTEDFVIVLDSNYSPVKNVFFKEEIIVTSLVDKEEKLTLDIETSGSVSPKKALEEALYIISSIWENIEKRVRDLS